MNKFVSIVKNYKANKAYIKCNELLCFLSDFLSAISGNTSFAGFENNPFLQVNL